MLRVQDRGAGNRETGATRIVIQGKGASAGSTEAREYPARRFGAKIGEGDGLCQSEAGVIREGKCAAAEGRRGGLIAAHPREHASGHRLKA